MELDEEFADAASAERLRAAYTGRHEVTDALWWRSHPLEQGPSGAASPAAEADRLARLVFSRDGADSATVVAHAAAESQLEADRRDIDEAIERARATEPTPPVDVPDELEDAGEAAPRRRAPRLVVAGVIAAILVAAVAGAWVGTTIPVAPGPTTTSASGSYEPPALGISQGGPSAGAGLAIFDRAQVTSGNQSDLPDVSQALVTEYDLDSFRRIDSLNLFSSGADSVLDPDAATPAAVVFAARTNANRACVVAITQQRIAGAACAVETEFPLNGLVLTFPVGTTIYTVSMKHDGTAGGFTRIEG